MFVLLLPLFPLVSMMSISLCSPGPCGQGAVCQVTDLGEDCQCRPGTTGDPFTICQEPSSGQGQTTVTPGAGIPETTEPDTSSPDTSVNETLKPEISKPETSSPDSQGPQTLKPGTSITPTPPHTLRPPTPSPEMSRPQTTEPGRWPPAQRPTPASSSSVSNVPGVGVSQLCPGICGSGAQCSVIQDHPVCSCPPGTVGSPLVTCRGVTASTVSTASCRPGSCAEGFLCREVRGVAVCGLRDRVTDDWEQYTAEVENDWFGENNPVGVSSPACSLDACADGEQCRMIRGLHVCYVASAGFSGNAFISSFK